MRILAIETSCDETAVCVIDATGGFSDVSFRIRGNALYSQASSHAEYGGVYPTLARRKHAKNLVPLLSHALGEAGLLSKLQPPSPGGKAREVERVLEREPMLAHELLEFARIYPPPEIDAIAVTKGPGLPPALWVGVTFAEALAKLWNKPLYGINHMEGHIISSLATHTEDTLYALNQVEFPVLALLISGGHTELILQKFWGRYELVGRTRDDAVGEAFDKVARMLGLPYPGGPHISRRAARSRSKKRDKKRFTLPRPMIHEKHCDFSFSGLKTSALYALKKVPHMDDDMKDEFAEEFENAVTDVLLSKTKRALEEREANTFVIGGGVAANTYIRDVLSEVLHAEFPHIDIRLPALTITGDNAIMIACAAYLRILGNKEPDDTLRAESNLRIEA